MYAQQNGKIVKTARSMYLAERRAVAKADTTKYFFSAQEKADEKWLSRSRPYQNKGRQEAARRLARTA